MTFHIRYNQFAIAESHNWLSSGWLQVNIHSEKNYSFLMISQNISQWEELCVRKRAAIKAKIPKHWLLNTSIIDEGKKRRQIAGAFIEDLLPPDVLRITLDNCFGLTEKIRDKSLTAFQVVEAFCRRTAVAQQIVKASKTPF